jgi:hypothetical protein
LQQNHQDVKCSQQFPWKTLEINCITKYLPTRQKPRRLIMVAKVLAISTIVVHNMKVLEQKPEQSFCVNVNLFFICFLLATSGKHIQKENKVTD